MIMNKVEITIRAEDEGALKRESDLTVRLRRWHPFPYKGGEGDKLIFRKEVQITENSQN